jgi:hypothetical protein
VSTSNALRYRWPSPPALSLGSSASRLITGGSGIADSLLQEAAKRLQIVSLVVLALWLIYSLWGLALQRLVAGTQLAQVLAACVLTDEWTEEQARRWWELHLPLDSGEPVERDGNVRMERAV